MLRSRNKMINTYICIFSRIRYLKGEGKIIIVLYAASSPSGRHHYRAVIDGGAIRLFAFSAASHANPSAS